MFYFILKASALMVLAAPVGGYHTKSFFDHQLNLTPRVLDRTIVKDVETQLPYTAPDGTKYEQTAQNIKRIKTLRNIENFCKQRLSDLGLDANECVTVEVK